MFFCPVNKSPIYKSYSMSAIIKIKAQKILITTTMISIATRRIVDKQHVTSLSSAFPQPNYFLACDSSADTSSKQRDMLAVSFDDTQGTMYPFDRGSCDVYSKSQSPGSLFNRRYFANNTNASFPFSMNLQSVLKRPQQSLTVLNRR